MILLPLLRSKIILFTGATEVKVLDTVILQFSKITSDAPDTKDTPLLNIIFKFLKVIFEPITTGAFIVNNALFKPSIVTLEEKSKFNGLVTIPVVASAPLTIATLL